MSETASVDASIDAPLLPEPVTLPAILERTVRRHGEREAFVGSGQRLTWNDLRAGALRMASQLAAAGVVAGDHVGVLMGNSAEWVQAFYACASLGAVTVPINTRFRLDELQYCLKQANVSTLVFIDRFLTIDFVDLLRTVEPALDTQLPGGALPRLRRAIMLGDGPCPAGAVRLADLPSTMSLPDGGVDDSRSAGLQACPNPEDVLLIQYTSGTTSFPKGVILTHRNMLQNAAAVARRMGVRPDDRYFSIRPYYHVAGTTLSLLVALATGACILTLPSFDVAAALRMLDEERCTLTSGNDTIFLMLMGHPAFNPARLHLRGGLAAAGPEVMQRIHDEMRASLICNCYGLSEASPNVAVSSYLDPAPLRIAGLFFPHPGVDVRIADPETGEVMAADVPGEIQVRGWSVMRGYYDMPDATARAFTSDGWLRTGDLGALNAEGRLRMIGRLKEVFRVGGENVAPAEVEETLHAHPAVKMAQVVGVPDARLGEVGAAYVMLRPGTSATPDELVAWCKSRCANFKVPRYVRIVETFDHIGITGSSKVQKSKLREHALDDFNLRSA